MPELPEVETVRLQLLHSLKNRKITGVEVFHAKSSGSDEAFEDKLVGKKFKYIDRVGKLLIFSFTSEPDLFILSHLRMTGQFFYIEDNGDMSGGGHSLSASDLGEFPTRHTRISFTLDNGANLYFNDMRIFGYMKLATKTEVTEAKKGYGPEPIDPDFDTKWFFENLIKKNKPVKAALLDQTFISGLGNIYVDEALWQAKVHPERKASSITKKEALAIAKAAGDVMNHSIEVGGTTFQHFKDVDGKTGNFTQYLQVFGKQGLPCPRCESIIKKIRVAGRGTHFCPKCQQK